jgi:hypothetical protein
MSTTDQPTVPPSNRGAALLLTPFLIGSAVAVALGVYGSLHQPTGKAVNLAHILGALGSRGSPRSQWPSRWSVGSALAMCGGFRCDRAVWVSGLRRWSGRFASSRGAGRRALTCAVGFGGYRAGARPPCSAASLRRVTVKMLVLPQGTGLGFAFWRTCLLVW